MIQTFQSLLFPILIGSGLVVGGTGAGWVMGRWPALPPVQWIEWWVRHVVHRILRARTWLACAVGIFLNNTVSCGLTVAAGPVAMVSWVAVCGLGLGLGIGLRLMTRSPFDFDITEPRCLSTRRRVRIGVALNMLEPPAIAIATGLSLGQRALAIGLEPGAAWHIFGMVVTPLLLIAAFGEALWLHALRRPVSMNEHAPSPDAHEVQHRVTDIDAHADID